MNLIAYIALFAAALIGGVLGLQLDKIRSKQYLGFILPFSGSFLLGVAVLHMLPEVYFESNGEYSIGVYILLGFLIQIMLEFLSKGVEHGHVHGKKNRNSSYLLSIMFGLCAHAFLEGMPVGSLNEMHASHSHSIFGQPYLWGIVAHKLPAATALSLLLLVSEVKRSTMFIMLFIFAAMSPLGALVTNAFDFSTAVQKIILGIAIGSILHVATIIIFETDGNAHHNISYRKLFAVLLGFSIAFLSVL